MSVISVNERYQERSSTVTPEGITAIRAFAVETDSPTDGSYTARTAGGVPRKGDPHNEEPGCIANTINAAPLEAEGSRTLWRVQVDYQQDPTDLGSGGGGDQANTGREIVFSFDQTTKVRQFSALREPFTNSAGDPYGDGVEIDEQNIVMEVRDTLPFEKFTIPFLIKWRNTVHGPILPKQKGIIDPLQVGGNNPPPLFFEHFPQFTAKFAGVTGGTQLVGGDTVWSIGLRFMIDETFLLALLDNGFYSADVQETEFSPGNPQNILRTLVKRITDDEGNPVQVPVMLDGNGQKADDGIIRYNVFQQHKHGDLNQLLSELGMSAKLSEYRVRFE
jgi:hypothetical protein